VNCISAVWGTINFKVLVRRWEEPDCQRSKFPYVLNSRTPVDCRVTNIFTKWADTASLFFKLWDTVETGEGIYMHFTYKLGEWCELMVSHASWALHLWEPINGIQTKHREMLTSRPSLFKSIERSLWLDLSLSSVHFGGNFAEAANGSPLPPASSSLSPPLVFVPVPNIPESLPSSVVGVDVSPRFRNSLMNKVSGLLSPAWCQTKAYYISATPTRNQADCHRFPYLTFTSKPSLTSMSTWSRKGRNTPIKNFCKHQVVCSNRLRWHFARKSPAGYSADQMQAFSTVHEPHPEGYVSQSLLESMVHTCICWHQEQCTITKRVFYCNTFPHKKSTTGRNSEPQTSGPPLWQVPSS